MILLTAAGLLVRTFLYSFHADLGFQRKDLLVADVGELSASLHDSAQG